MQPGKLIGFLYTEAGLGRSVVKFHAALAILGITVALSIAARAQTAAATIDESEQPALPSWLKSVSYTHLTLPTNREV